MHRRRAGRSRTRRAGLTSQKRLYLRSIGDDPNVPLVVAATCGLSTEDARALLRRIPVVVPRRYDAPAADELAARLRRVGVAVELESADGLPSPPCKAHPALESYASCTQCKAALCAVCEGRSGTSSLCGTCGDARAKKKRNQRIRVAILLGILVVVAVFALTDFHRRRARKDWDHTLSVAVVLLDDSGGALDPKVLERFQDRIPALEARLASEQGRYRTGAPPPFAITVFGPVAVATPPPAPPNEDGVVALAKHSLATSRYYEPIDERAGLAAKAYDSRIYVVVHRSTVGSSFAEGSSEQDGRMGTVGVEIGDGSVDLALIVVAHELFHTLGATDKYDATGRVKRPDGLAEPELGADQRFVELMARTRPIRGEERYPDVIDDVAVGPVTAKEIGWSP